MWRSDGSAPPGVINKVTAALGEGRSMIAVVVGAPDRDGFAEKFTNYVASIEATGWRHESSAFYPDGKRVLVTFRRPGY